jgi:hypothetical protein
MLSKAVTEYMFYFIGHGDPPPQSAGRYHAVCGAHVTHMLRDMLGDIECGYFNIPCEVLDSEHISLVHLNEQSFRKWVYQRGQLAHDYFDAGWQYISRVKSFRCRLAGFAYMARFQWMLRAIEQDQYCLRPEYPEQKHLRAILWMIWSVLKSFLHIRLNKYTPAEPVVITDHYEEK